MNSGQIIIGLTFLVYILAMLAIGWVGYRRTSDLSDFVLGGRSLGSWVTALSASASDMSGWLLLGLPGFAYLSGMESLWLSGGLLAGTWLNWRFLAARLRRYSEAAHNALTLPAFFAHRFHDDSGLLRGLSALFILIFFLFYTASGLVAGGKLFSSVFGLPYTWAVIGGALVIILYTSFGGFLAVSWTDLVQGLLMAAALIAVPLMAFTQLGGASAIAGKITHYNPHLLDPFTDGKGAPLTLTAIVSLMAWGLGYFGQPHILARFKAIRSPEQLPRARRIAITWVAVSLAGASLVGLVGVPMLNPPLADADSEKVFIHLVNLLFHPVVAGICLAAILAAIMSTADSQLLVASSAFTEDLYKGLVGRDADEQNRVRLGRLAVWGIALLATLLALDPESKVLDLVAYAWAGFGAAFGPPLILALFWRRMTRNGALAGICAGGITVVAWKQLHGGLFDLYEIVPGFLLATLATLLVSLSDPPPAKATTDLFDEVAEASQKNRYG